MNAHSPKIARRVLVSGAPFFLNAEHFAHAIIASARIMGVHPYRALAGQGPERRAIAPALFALSAETGVPFGALTPIVHLSKTDAYKARRRAGKVWLDAERAAALAVRRVYAPLAGDQPATPIAIEPVEVVPAAAPAATPVKELEPPCREAKAPAKPHNTGHALKPLVFRRDDRRETSDLLRVGERALPDRILDALGERSLTTNTLAVILGAKELPVGDCLTNLMRSGEVTCEEFMDGHVRRRRWSRSQ